MLGTVQEGFFSGKILEKEIGRWGAGKGEKIAVLRILKAQISQLNLVASIRIVDLIRCTSRTLLRYLGKLCPRHVLLAWHWVYPK